MKTKYLFISIFLFCTLILSLVVVNAQSRTLHEEFGASNPPDFAIQSSVGLTERVSVSSEGDEGNETSWYSSISEEGRYVAFESEASNLVSGDTNGVRDIFVYDRQIGQTQRVSVASDGTQGNNSSNDASISTNGRFVTFYSGASNLISSDTNFTNDIFIHDLENGVTTLISKSSQGVQGNSSSYYPSISTDGRYIAFSSNATNLVSGDNNGKEDIFLHDRETGETTRVSVSSIGTQGTARCFMTSISATGRYIGFSSEDSNLVSGDTNGTYDAFIHDTQTGITERISIANDGAQGDGHSYVNSFSDDGRYVGTYTTSSNFVEGDVNGESDVFIYDQETKLLTLISVASDGTHGDDQSVVPYLSADGRYVAFSSQATNFVTGGTGNFDEAYVHDRVTGNTALVSVASDGTYGNSYSHGATISADGRCISFSSMAGNFAPGDTLWFTDVFMRNCFSFASGKVTYGDGSPIEGVTISDGNGLITTTNSSGEYTLDGFPPGTYTITPSLGSYTFSPSSIEITVPGNARNIDFVGGFSISGSITYGNGSPVSGVIMSANGGIATTSNSIGEYAFEFLAPGSYSISPSKSNHSFSPSSIEISTPPDAIDVDFVGGFGVSGRISYGNGSPIDGVTITSSGETITTSNSSGEYTFEYIAPGTYSITPSKSGYSFSPTSIEITVPPDASDVDFIGGFGVSGNIAFGDGSLVSGVTISAGGGNETISNSSGEYSFEYLSPGTYSITPSKSVYSFSPSSIEMTVPPNASDVDFVGGFSISGYVTYNDLSPMPEVLIYDGPVLMTTTDENGFYMLENMPPELCHISPYKVGFEFYPTSIEVTLPPNANEISFTGIKVLNKLFIPVLIR